MNPRQLVAAAKLPVLQTGKREWRVQGRTEFSYAVTQSGWTQEFSCTCVAFSFGNDCRHILAVRMRLQQQAKAQEKAS